MLYANAKGGVAMTLIAAGGLSGIMADHLPRPVLVAWSSAVALVIGLRSLDVWLWHPRRMAADERRAGPGRWDPRREFRCFAGGVSASAVLWAAIPCLFWSWLSMSENALVTIVLAGMAGGSAAVLGASWPLATAYCAAMLLPLSATFLASSDGDSIIVGLLGIVFFVVLSAVSRNISRMTAASFELSRANMRLRTEREAERARSETVSLALRATRAELREANRTLESGIDARTADLHRATEALSWLATTDTLTGIANRNMATERLASRIAAAGQAKASLAVLFIDLDRFKEINDTHGHLAGDKVLRAVAHRLRDGLPTTADLGRWGGDEFLAVFPCTSTADAVNVGLGLHSAMLMPLQLSGGDVVVGSTIGIAMYPHDGLTQDDLLMAADAAMYAGKQAGASRVRPYDTILASELRERQRIERALTETLAADENPPPVKGFEATGSFRLVYQPVISGKDDTCVAMEALLRWRHPVLGDVEPSRMIPIAERSDLIGLIGAWVLRRACHAATSWPEPVEGKPIAVAVNVSVAQILSGRIVRDVVGALEASGLAANRLLLEITESLLANDHGRIAPVLAKLRDRGVRIAIDDFGAGFSSISSLRALPVDLVKVDQSFVRSMDEKGDALLAAILAVVDALGLEVVAEGLETPEQASRMRELKVEYLQGFLFSRPMASDDVAEWLSRQDQAAGSVTR